jgi:hypothetical protein
MLSKPIFKYDITKTASLVGSRFLGILNLESQHNLYFRGTMNKKFTILILSQLFFQTVHAQVRKDTLVFYMKNNGLIINDKAAADYLLIILPADSSSGKKLYPVNEYYPSGKTKLMGMSSTVNNSITFEGSCISFFSNGRRKSITNYNNGYLTGDMTLYYPNGHFYATKKIDENGHSLLIDCQDSTGNILAQGGNGAWLKFDDDANKVIEEGQVRNGLEVDEWYYRVKNDTTKYARFYNQGKLISPIDSNKEPVFARVQKEPVFIKGGAAGFNKYLAKNVIFPEYDKQNRVRGKVIVTFVVEKDGTLSNIIALREPDQFIAKEAIRVISLSPPWNPGTQNGLPVRTQFTIQFSFSLAD